MRVAPDNAVTLLASDIERVPPDHIRVPLFDFASVWNLAEVNAPFGWYPFGVAATCEWIGCTRITHDHDGLTHIAPSPLCKAPLVATAERIEWEWQQAQALAREDPVPPLFADRPGWIEAVAATWGGRGLVSCLPRST